MSGHEARINNALTTLGEEFRLGMVAAEEYRTRRRMLFESWNERDVTTSPGSLKSMSTSTGPGTATNRTAIVPPPPRNSAPVVVVAVVALAIVAAGAWFVLSHRAATARAATAAVPANAEVQAIKKVTDEFLARNNWDPEPVETFLALWGALSEADRARALEEPSLRTMRYEIKQNLQAESQLVAADAPPGQRRRLDVLTRFARELGD